MSSIHIMVGINKCINECMRDWCSLACYSNFEQVQQYLLAFIYFFYYKIENTYKTLHSLDSDDSGLGTLEMKSVVLPSKKSFVLSY